MSALSSVLGFIAILIGFGVVLYWAEYAPEGWEDETGFHFGVLPAAAEEQIAAELGPYGWDISAEDLAGRVLVAASAGSPEVDCGITEHCGYWY